MGIRKDLDAAFQRGREDGRWGRPNWHYGGHSQERDEARIRWAYEAGFRAGVEEQVQVVTKIQANQEINRLAEGT
jgi:hypothetical protein